MLDITKYPEVLEKARSYCSYSERCEFDVMSKLREWKVDGKLMPKVIEALKDENYIDEMRYACAFARGKFRIKKWGRNKIRAELRAKKIPDAAIEAGLLEIDDNEYQKVLRKIIDQKKTEFVDPDNYINRNKIYIFVLSKGYEKQLILKYL
jgi:regulatory protein